MAATVTFNDVSILMVDAGPAMYYDESFRNVLEDHMNYLRTNPSTMVLTLDPIRVYQYANDLFGLLQLYDVPLHLHFVIMRMNKLTKPNADISNFTSLLVPNATTVDMIRQSYVNLNRIS
jgi:hypothetical protein